MSPFYLQEMICVHSLIRGLPSAISVEVGSQYQSMNWSKLISEERFVRELTQRRALTAESPFAQATGLGVMAPALR